MRLVCVIMMEESPNQFYDTVTLFDYGYSNFSLVNVGDYDTEWMLKKAPQGFPQDFEHIDWLKRKAFTFSTPLTDKQVCSKDFVALALDIAKAAKPMNDFLNYTFEEYGEFTPDER